ncbi:hypothetical protein RYX36_008613 [Vicia faba]
MFDVAREISKNLANNALIYKVNEDSLLQMFKFDDDEGRDTFWNSSAHILGHPLETEYECKLCTGPCTTREEGFYYTLLRDYFYSSPTVFAATPAVVFVHAKDESYLSTTIPKRISVFKAIQAEQQTRRLSLSSDPIKVTLPDKKVKEGKKWQITLFDVAREISKNLANNALIYKVNGVLWDMNCPLEEELLLQIFKFDDDEGRDTFLDSSAHILG